MTGLRRCFSFGSHLWLDQFEHDILCLPWATSALPWLVLYGLPSRSPPALKQWQSHVLHAGQCLHRAREGLTCFSFVLVLRALQAPKEPLVLLVKKAKEVPAESLVVLGPSAPLEKE